MVRYSTKKRVLILFGAFICLFICIGLKLGFEQLIHHEQLLHKAYDLWERDFMMSGHRGRIFDRNGEILAQDVPCTSTIVVPSQIQHPKKVANQLADILHCDQNILLKKLTKHQSTVRLHPEGRFLTARQVDAIQKLDEKGIYIVQDSKRYYPNHTSLSQVLGFTGMDHQGLAGIELQYDSILKAQNGSLKIPLDAKGNAVSQRHESIVPAGYGMDVYLTIDAKIQAIVEREMDILMKRYHPKSVLALAMDPKTGEVLAMVSKPDFDPNHYQDYDHSIYNQNLPIWKSFEPGSTFKSVTFASALDLSLFDMFKDTYDDIGYEMVSGARIKSWKVGGHGHQTFLQVLENSSNPGFVEISRRLGLENQYAYLKRFGFGEKTGIDLPGESSGILFKKENMHELEQATVAFGQGLSVTPIQLVTAFSAIINGGHLYQPYITKRIEDPYLHQSILSYEPVLKRKVIKPETSKQMRYALESVVANGGGKQAYIQGYRIGGKTGTAQIAEHGVYSKSRYILSFLSAAPMEDPKIVLYIAADSPQNDILYGGTVVAPVAKSCYEDILPYMNVKKTTQQLPKKLIWPETEQITVKNFVGMQKKEVIQEGLHMTFFGDGDIVLEQFPEPGTRLLENQKEVWIYLGNAKAK